MKSTAKCVTGKKMYESKVLAEDALIEARTRFDYTLGQGPIAVYLCDDCGNYHLTSQGKINERLAEELEKGTIRLQKEANRWLDKFKNK